MFNVEIFLEGKLIARGVLKDKGNLETLGLDEATYEAHKMLRENNFNYDHIKVSFVNLPKSSVESLERMLDL